MIHFIDVAAYWCSWGLIGIIGLLYVEGQYDRSIIRGGWSARFPWVWPVVMAGAYIKALMTVVS